jgi:hypothetical protein
MKSTQYHTPLSSYSFPVTFADVLPLDLTEAPPLPDVTYIGIDDQVVYECRNDLGAVILSTPATVINVNYRTQQVHLFVNPRLRFWVSVEALSVGNGVANQAAIAA